MAKPEGLGLGLAIAQCIAHRFDGDVTVVPSPAGSGATLVVELPAVVRGPADLDLADAVTAVA